MVGLAVLAVGAPHLLAGTHAWAGLSLAMGSCVVLGLALYADSRGGRQSDDVEPVAILLALMLTVTVAHALPLPASVAAHLAPEALENAQQTALGMGTLAPSVVAFSLDPGRTRERVLFGVAIFAAFCAARLSARQSRRASVLGAVAAGAALIAVSDLIHRATGATLVYGVFSPGDAAPRGPLLNPNNLAGFLALGFPICLGLATKASAGPRWIWALLGAVVAATNLLAGSRGGTAVLVGGGLCFGALYVLRTPDGASQNSAVSRRGQHGPRPQSSAGRSRLAGAALVLACVAMAWALASLAASDFVDTDYQDLSKFDLYRSEWQLLVSSPRTLLLGVGRGGFLSAFSRVSPFFTRSRDAESLPLQYALEFGLPLAVLLLGGAALRWVFALRHWRSPAQLGGLVGIAAISVQNLLDFSLERTGIALPAAVCLGAALPRLRSPVLARLTPVGLRQVASFGLIACVTWALTFGPAAVRSDALLAERELRQRSAERDVSAFWTRFGEVAPAHPADPAFPLLAGAVATDGGRGDVDFWLRRAMTLAPASSLPHLWAARSLAGRGARDRALGELKIAAALDPAQTINGLCAWVRGGPTAETVLRVAPSHGEARVAVLDAGAGCLLSYPAEAEQIDQHILAARPAHLPARLRTAYRDLAAKRHDNVIALARSILATSPNLSEAQVLEAYGLIRLGQPKEAAERLLRALPRTSEPRSILTVLAIAQTHAGDAEGMRGTVDRLRMAGAGQAQHLAAAAALLGENEGALGNHARALKAMREAHSLAPRPDYLASAAHLAGQLGQTDYALSAWEQLCGAEPTNKVYCDARDAMRATRQQP